MSDQGNRPPDEPTRAYTPVGGEDEATRLERAIPVYDEERPPVAPTALPPGYKERSIAGPLITVGLLCILIGILIGWVLFHNSGSDDNSPSSTTSSVVSTTSTTAATTSTSQATTTTAKATTTTTEKPTTTTAKPTTTTSSKNTTTTANPGVD